MRTLFILYNAPLINPNVMYTVRIRVENINLEVLVIRFVVVYRSQNNVIIIVQYSSACVCVKNLKRSIIIIYLLKFRFRKND